MTGNKRWFRVQSIGEIVRPDVADPEVFFDPAEPSIIRVDPGWESGLQGIEDFSHLVVLFYLDRAERRRVPGEPMKPEGRDELAPVGFFSTRTPRRPNPIGICCPKLVRRDGRDLHVTGLDGWNGTPVLDIKGYFPRDEQRTDAQVPGWLTDLWRRHDEERAVPIEAQFTRTLQTPHGNVTLREPTMADVQPALRFINALAAEETYILFQGQQLDEADEREYIVRRMSMRSGGSGITLMAVAGEEIVGSSLIDLLPLAASHVGDFSISVSEGWRGDGLGRALMAATIDHAVATLQGLRVLRLDVFANNEPAAALYRSMDFTECGRAPGAVLHRGEYIDLIQMVRQLKADS